MDEREVKTVLKYIRMTPRKVRVMADMIRDKDVDEAESLLMFADRRAVTPVRKALLTAINNAKQAK
ncbi:MAG: 50S ribosomal protein L22, partial [Deltaproteobacteria bacterium]|nr:50S ribosomal protein L22 [Deltaproteobacteria bacterium]